MYKVFVSVCLITLLQVSLSTAVAPIPFCNIHPIFQLLPISPDQIQSYMVSEIFSGYNLDIKLASNNSFASVTEKLIQLDKRGAYLPNIIAHQVEKNGNTWGKESYIMYKDISGAIHFAYGIQKDDHEVPEMGFTVLISNDPNVQCFSAVLFLEYGEAIVDCVRKSDTLENYFYFVNLVDHSIIQQKQNDLFVDFQTITKRKLIKYRHPQTGYTYLLRVYEAEGVDLQHADNTYMEIFSAQRPRELQVLKIIDRTFLHLPSLSIMDAKLYLDDIFFLDYEYGMFRIDILRNQDVRVMSRYNKVGFRKFAVYSDDLENQVLLALANQHAVYELDWSQMDPVLLNKYSLMEYSHVKQVLLNDRFLIVSAVVNATNSTSQLFQLDYTWVFTKNSRTYSNAYHIIPHNSSSTEIDLDRENSRLLIADEMGITLWQLDEVRLNMLFNDESMLGKSEEVTILATSSDPNYNQSFSCQEKFTMYFVKAENQTVFQTLYPTTSTYSINYPGQLYINLIPYGLGPNLTYSLTNVSYAHDLPPIWVDKRNLTTVHINQTYQHVTFYHTQVVPEIGYEVVTEYVEQSSNVTHVIECRHTWETADIFCKEQATYQHPSAISAFTTAYFTDHDGFFIYYVISLGAANNVANIYDYTRHKKVATIEYHGQYDAVISEMAASSGFLYILRSAIKTIDVYNLRKCEQLEICEIQFQIDAATLKPLGVKYFSPQKIVTDAMHPEVLFIQCLGSVLILDIDNKEKMTVLQEIIYPFIISKFYRIVVNQKQLIIVSDPDVIALYSLEHIYTKNRVIFMKYLPVYGYAIQATSDLGFSSIENTFYLSAYELETNKSVILAYKTGLPAASALFDVIHLDKLYSRPELEIEVSGFKVDFLHIRAGDEFFVYRMFESPRMVIQNAVLKLGFQIEASNTQDNLTSDLVGVEATNYPEGISLTEKVNETLNDLQLRSEGEYTWDDYGWYVGHVTNFLPSCDECGDEGVGKVSLKTHVDNERDLGLNAYDYHETTKGGVGIYKDLLKFNINGSIASIIDLPDPSLLERCQRVTSSLHGQFVVSACQQLSRGMKLYITTTESFKAWTWGPYTSAAHNARKLSIAGDILMLVDTSTFPEYRNQKGRVFLYSLTYDRFSHQLMDELQIIDEDDLLGTQSYRGDSVVIANADLVYLAGKNIFRLYVTEVSNGLFIVDFTHEIGRDEISIRKIEYIDLAQTLVKQDLHLPSDASFQAVSLLGYKFNPHFETESVLVVTKGYHNIEFLIVYDDDSFFVSCLVHRVYLRYAFYNTVNEVAVTPGFFAVSYVVPPLFERDDYSEQYIVVYDTLDYEGQHIKSYGERYMLGAHYLNVTTQSMFAFNTTYKDKEKVGLVVTMPFQVSRNMQELEVSRKLEVKLAEGFSTQTLEIFAFNDFDMASFSVQIVSPSMSETALIIVIVVLAVLVTIGFLGYLVFIMRKSPKPREERQSLLTEEEHLRQTVILNQEKKEEEGYAPPSSEESGEVSDDEGEDDDGEEDDEVEKKQNQEENIIIKPVEEKPTNLEQQVKTEEKPLPIESIVEEEKSKVEEEPSQSP